VIATKRWSVLLREERLRVCHGSVDEYKTEFVLEPYTLLVYKKGLYLAGLSHHHAAVRTFSLDGFRSVEWLRSERFTYPAVRGSAVPYTQRSRFSR
jgi:predicted DNA-binding transcriptional regulator YafY